MTIIFARIVFWTIVVCVILGLVAYQYHKSGRSFPWIKVIMVAIALSLIVGITSCANTRTEKKKEAAKKMTEAANPATNSVPVTNAAPSGVIYAETPRTLILNYEFNIEADGPVMVKYPGERPVLFTPGTGYQQLPVPQSSGPKIFTDPNDPTNGHIRFRIYPVLNGR